MKEKERNVVVLVSHGASIDSWAAYFKDASFKGEWPYCSISMAEWKEGEWALRLSADDSHIE